MEKPQPARLSEEDWTSLETDLAFYGKLIVRILKSRDNRFTDLKRFPGLNDHIDEINQNLEDVKNQFRLFVERDEKATHFFLIRAKD